MSDSEIDGTKKWNEDIKGGKKSRYHKFLFEFSTMLFFLGKFSSIPLSQMVIYRFVSNKYNVSFEEFSKFQRDEHFKNDYLINHKNLSTFEIKNCALELNQSCSTSSGHLLEMFKIIRDESNSILLYLIIYEYIPNALVSLFFGVLSDSIGKRSFLMYIPCLGLVFYSLGFVLPVYFGCSNIENTFTKSSVIIATLLLGFSGGIGGYCSGYGSYICDTETPEKQTIRVAVMQATLGVTFGVGTFISSIFFDYINKIEPFWIVFAVSLVSFLIILCFIEESLIFKVNNKNNICKNILQKISKFKQTFNPRNATSLKMWLYIVIFELFFISLSGHERLFTIFFLGPPFFWNYFEIGVFFLLFMGISGLTSWPGIYIWQKIFNEFFLYSFSLFLSSVGAIILAFSCNYLQVIAASCFLAFFFIPFSVGKTLIFRNVPNDDIGTIYGLLHCLMSLANFIGPFVFTLIYSETVNYMSGLAMLVTGLVLIVPFPFLVWIFFINKRDYQSI